MFEFNTEGYKKAKEWLESIGDNYSADGWSVILYANDKWNRICLIT